MRRYPAPRLVPIACVLASLAIVGCQRDQPVAPPQPSLRAERSGNEIRDTKIPDRLQHLVVIYLENHSFDNLYGEFPGADGLSNAAATETQVDATGTPFATLPEVSGSPFPLTL